MAKIYLSPALHAHDNPTKCPMKCGENVHCNQFMDVVEKRLKECGVEVKRGDPNITGDAGCALRTGEANRWGADLYYVAHTNAGGGRYAVTYCYPNDISRQKADTLGRYHKAVEAHNGAPWRRKTSDALWEINATTMVTLYDELFFHDNEEDCRWFHSGGMEQIAEETVQGLCAVVGARYQAPVTSKPAETKPVETKPAQPKPAEPAKPAVPKAGDKVVLNKGKLYIASTGSASVTRTGTYYLYDGQKINGRYRVTNRTDRVNKKPVLGNVSGWVIL